MPRSVNLGRLQIFDEVARCGTFSAAAEALSYSPSAVSQQMAKLEAELATALVVRTPRGVSLTDAGQLLRDRTQAILAEVRAARAELDALAGLRRGDRASRLLRRRDADRSSRARCARSRSASPPSTCCSSTTSRRRTSPGCATGEFDLALVRRMDGGAEEGVALLGRCSRIPSCSSCRRATRSRTRPRRSTPCAARRSSAAPAPRGSTRSPPPAGSAVRAALQPLRLHGPPGGARAGRRRRGRRRRPEPRRGPPRPGTVIRRFED